MRRRLTLIAIAAMAAIVTGPTAASGWMNGGDTLDDVFWGTHDWVVWQAYEQAGRPDWFRIEEAILSSDEPDRSDPDRYDHIYHVASGYGGAPFQVGEHYTDAVDAYVTGDHAAASRAVGVLSHYLSDACQPFHTVSRFARPEYGLMHGPYERAAVAPYHLKAQAAMIVPRERRAFTDVRSLTRKASAVANAQLATLVAGFAVGGIDHPSVRYASDIALNEAVNGLADIIAAVPSGYGQARPAYRISSLTPYRRYVARYRKARADVRLVDRDGRPVRGVRVEFTWSLEATTHVDVRYTDGNGRAYSHMDAGSQPYFERFTVTARTTSAGRRLTAGTWLVTTPVLKSGDKGFRAWVSSRRPHRRTDVTAYAICLSKAGTPVEGLRVRFTWRFKSGKVVTYAVTDARGVARCTRNIGTPSRTYTVRVHADTQSGGSNRTDVAAFRPR